jgi:hypothetical protein
MKHPRHTYGGFVFSISERGMTKNRALFEEPEVTVKEQGKQNPTSAGRLETPLLAHERQAGKQRALALYT